MAAWGLDMGELERGLSSPTHPPRQLALAVAVAAVVVVATAVMKLAVAVAVAVVVAVEGGDSGGG